MILRFPDGKISNVKEDELKEGDIVGDWKFTGNTTKPGSAIWNEWKNIKTGESTLKTYNPQVVTCNSDHHFKYIDRNFNYQCMRCGVGGRATPDKYKLQNGKLISTTLN